MGYVYRAELSERIIEECAERQKSIADRLIRIRAIEARLDAMRERTAEREAASHRATEHDA